MMLTMVKLIIIIINTGIGIDIIIIGNHNQN